MSKLLIQTCLLRFLGAGLMTLSQTYANMVFLSAYPANWIAYLYLGNGILTVCLMQIFKNLMKSGVPRFVIINHWVFLLSLFPFVWLLETSFWWAPFVFASFVLTIVFFANMDYWLIVTRLFNLREFKVVGKWVSLAATLGAIITGGAIPIILHFFQPIILLYIFISVVILAIMILYSIDFSKGQDDLNAPQPVKKLLSIPLFMNVFLALMLMLCISTLADYSMMREMSLNYSQKEIGNILAPFFSITSIITVGLQLFGIQKIIDQYSVIGLLYAFPLSMILSSLSFLTYPGLITALFLAGVAQTIRYSYYSLGHQLVINVLPGSLRYQANYQMTGVGRNLGVGIASLLLVIVNFTDSLRLVGFFIIFLCIALFWICNFIRENYSKSLKEAINLHRFNLDYLSTEKTDYILTQKAAIEALKSESEEVQLYGQTLIRSLHLNSIPDYVAKGLNSKEPLMKIETIRTFESINNPESWTILEEQIKKETNAEVIWRLVNALPAENMSHLLELAEHYMHSPDIAFEAIGVCILIKGGFGGINQLTEMLESSDPQKRIWGCRIMKHIDIRDLDHDILRLINDNNKKVAKEAISAAKKHYNEEIVDAIINKLPEKNLHFEITRTLKHFGPGMIKKLVKKMGEFKQQAAIKSCVLIISKFPEEESEKVLFELLDSPNGTIQNAAIINLAYRAKVYPISEAGKNKLLELINHKANEIEDLRILLNNSEDEDVKREIISRIYFKKSDFLYLLAAYSQANIILQLIPTLLNATKEQPVYQKAVELLDINLPKRSMIAYLPVVLEEKVSAKLVIPKTFDPWLLQVIRYKKGELKGKIMEIVEKVVCLRKVALFGSLSAEALQYIVENLKVMDVAAGQQLFKEGDIADGLYIVARGSVTVKKGELEIKHYDSCDFFGELALLDNEPRTATAIASKDSLLFLLEKNDFDRITDDIPEILKVIVQTIMGYIRKTG